MSFKGEPLLRPRWRRMARAGFAYLPDRDLLAPHRTVREHLELVVRQFEWAGYDEAVERCELGPLLDARCAGLSTGERRRAEVAVMLARRPDCLLADEPYRNLDPADRHLLADAFRALAAAGCAVVVTGHEVEDLALGADAITWCTDGTTYELGPPRAALTHWRLVRDYLGAARGERLLEALDSVECAAHPSLN